MSEKARIIVVEDDEGNRRSLVRALTREGYRVDAFAWIERSKLEQLTFDHSLVWEMSAAGRIPEGEVPDYVPRNIITRSLGPDDQVDASLPRRRMCLHDAVQAITVGHGDRPQPQVGGLLDQLAGIAGSFEK